MNDTTLNLRYAGRTTLSSMLAELERQKETKHDVIIKSTDLTTILKGNDCTIAIAARGNKPQIREHLNGGIPLTDNALAQLCERLTPKPPVTFIRNLLSPITPGNNSTAQKPSNVRLDHAQVACDILSNLLYHNDDSHFLRMLDDRIRAVLSRSYRVMDHYDALFRTLEVAKELKAQPIECRLTPSHMKLKLVDFNTAETLDQTPHTGHQWTTFGGAGNAEMLANTDMAGWIGQPGKKAPIDPNRCHPCVTISNSETGQGGFTVSLGIFWSACCNGAIIEQALRSIHVGGKKMDGIVFAHDTQTSESHTVSLKIRDILRTAFTPATFAALIRKCNAASTDVLPSVTSAVDNLIDNDFMPKSQRDALLTYFLRDYAPTRAGLAGAITRLAQDGNADTATDLEVLAGRVLTTPSLLQLA